MGFDTFLGTTFALSLAHVRTLDTYTMSEICCSSLKRRSVSPFRSGFSFWMSTNFCTSCPTFRGEYVTSSPSFFPAANLSALAFLASSARLGMGESSKSELKCQKNVEEIRTSGLSGASTRRCSMTPNVCSFTTTSWKPALINPAVICSICLPACTNK